MTRTILACLVAAAGLFPALPAFARGPATAHTLAHREEAQDEQEKPRDVTHFNLGKDKLALQGYDPVAYFPEGGAKATKGLASIAVVHDGVAYRFASEANKKTFLASPARFEPQYGGWCAYAMADGEKVEIDPQSFLVTDGKLYVFFKAWYADTRAKWKKDELRLMQRADKAWTKLLEPPKPK